MTAVLPLRALVALTGPARPLVVLVGRRRGSVLHLAVPGRRGLTPAGHLRRADRPLCGRPAPSWPTVPVDGRPLCQRCEAAALRLADVHARDVARAMTRGQLAVSITTARDEAALHAAVLAVCDGPPALLRPLTRLVPPVRARLTRPRPSFQDELLGRAVAA